MNYENHFKKSQLTTLQVLEIDLAKKIAKFYEKRKTRQSLFTF